MIACPQCLTVPAIIVGCTAAAFALGEIAAWVSRQQAAAELRRWDAERERGEYRESE